MLSEIVEEGDDFDDTSKHFSEFVDPTNVPPDEYRPPAPPSTVGGKKSPPPTGSPLSLEHLKTFSEIDTLLLYQKKREVKTIIRYVSPEPLMNAMIGTN